MTQTALFQALQRNRFPARAGGSGIRAGLGRLGKGPWNDRTPDGWKLEPLLRRLVGPSSPLGFPSPYRSSYHPKAGASDFSETIPSHPISSQEPHPRNQHTHARAPDGPTGKQAENFGRGQFPFLFSANPHQRFRHCFPSPSQSPAAPAPAAFPTTTTRQPPQQPQQCTPPASSSSSSSSSSSPPPQAGSSSRACAPSASAYVPPSPLPPLPLPSPKPPPTQLTPRLPAPPAPSFLLHPLPPLVFVPLRRAHPRPRRHRRVVQRPRARLQEPEQPDGGGRLRGVAFDQRARSRSR